MQEAPDAILLLFRPPCFVPLIFTKKPYFLCLPLNNTKGPLLQHAGKCWS